MKIKYRKIGFIPDTENEMVNQNIELPTPSRLLIPDWYKETPLYIQNSRFAGDIGENVTVKACIPFLDSLSFGYMLTTQTDIQVASRTTTQPRFSWKGGHIPVGMRPDDQNDIPVPAGFSPIEYTWTTMFGFVLPKGYSMLITHPLNRFDLPFMCVSGIVDSGVTWSGKFSFWLKEHFEGVIPAGTPFAQLIPFKTDNWKSEMRKDLMDQAKYDRYKTGSISRGYKKMFHRKKSFE